MTSTREKNKLYTSTHALTHHKCKFLDRQVKRRSCNKLTPNPNQTKLPEREVFERIKLNNNAESSDPSMLKKKRSLINNKNSECKKGETWPIIF